MENEQAVSEVAEQPATEQETAPVDDSSYGLKDLNTEGQTDSAQESSTGEVEIEIGGKKFVMPEKDAIEILENRHKLTEKEKQLNRDYTQKTQAIAEQRKSFEKAFGRMPEQVEIDALGRLYQSYFTNAKARELVDQILTGKLQQQPVDPLDSKFQNLEERVFGTVQQILEQRETSQRAQEGLRIFQNWAADKAKQGTEITATQQSQIEAYIPTLRAQFPKWNANQILDRAFSIVNLDNLQKDAVNKVFTSADKAKTSVPKIKPSQPQKLDGDKGYRDIFLDE